jgi:hypothetical protein
VGFRLSHGDHRRGGDRGDLPGDIQKEEVVLAAGWYVNRVSGNKNRRQDARKGFLGRHNAVSRLARRSQGHTIS